MIDSFNFQTELNTSDERLVRSTFTVKLNGYIVPEVIQRDLNAVKKFNDKAKILLAIETDVSFEDVKNNVPIKKPNFISGILPSALSVTMNVNFSADKLTANVGELITFTDLTDNLPTAWGWNFGDGILSSIQNPTHSYLSSGVYTITLVTGNNNLGGVNTKTNYITII
jgi:PKD repeat protein